MIAKLNIFKMQPAGELLASADDRRLIHAAFPVLFLLSVVFSFHYTRNLADPVPFLVQESAVEMDRSARRSRIYPVLVQQNFAPEAASDQVRALSDVTAEGRGAVTENAGFHTLTDDDTLELVPGSMRSAVSAPEAQSETAAEQTVEREGHGPVQGQTRESQQGRQAEAQIDDEGRYRIPSNYRFQDDFALHYDSSGSISIARQELAGFDYFRSMLRQIREGFAAPGMNYAYRDNAGTVISQPIKPQSVQVLFSLDEQGNVRDVRKVSSMGQRAVDQACINALAGQNFGPPPPEVLAQGNVFGINFIFPAVMNR